MINKSDQVIVNVEFVNRELALKAKNAETRHCLEALGLLGSDPVTVLDIGQVALNRANVTSKFFIRALPKDRGSAGFNNGNGVVVYFEDQETLLKCFRGVNDTAAPERDEVLFPEGL